MMTQIILQEIVKRKWYIFWWSLGMAGFMALVIGVYPPFRDQAEIFNQSLSQIPDSFKSFIADTGDFLSPVGYMSSQAYYLVLPIIFGILVIGLGSSLLAKEEREHTIELLLSRPISRTRILSAKAIAGLAILSIIVSITIVTTILLAWMINLGIPFGYLAYATVLSALMPLVFGALSFMMTAMGHGARIASIGISTLLLIASYLFTSLSVTVDWLRWPSKLLPYHYYHPTPVLNGSLNGYESLGMLLAVLLFGVAAVLFFRRRDID